MEYEEAEKLFKRHKEGVITAKEQRLLNSWYIAYKTEPADLIAEDLLNEYELGYKRLQHYLDGNKKISLWPRIIAAASIVVLLGIGLFFYYPIGKLSSVSEYANDIAPGKVKATLTLANGKKIALSAAANGELAKESGIVITKTADGKLIYEIKSVADNANKGTTKLSYNTLTTAKGETYQVKLPDGTLVWLNAASSLKYPVSFAGLKQRNVELIGEAYFEVAKIYSGQAKQSSSERIPFFVKTDNQEVEVLGTHFNINSYADEGDTKTTLLEGAVKVIGIKSNIILKPNQESTLSNNGIIKVTAADITSAVSWKDNTFRFKDADIHTIMRQIARWYDIEVNYSNDIPPEHLTGYISRDVPLSRVLKMLEQTSDLNFSVAGKIVTVTK